jgi:Flp pilus assembly protein TadG
MQEQLVNMLKLFSKKKNSDVHEGRIYLRAGGGLMPACTSFLKRLASNRSGAIVILFALMLPLLIGSLGLGVEAVFWFSSKRDLQTAADAGAIAAAYEVANLSTSTVRDAEARAEAQRNVASLADADITINKPPAISTVYNDTVAFPDAVEVQVSAQITPLFVSFFSGDNITLTAYAVAEASDGGGEACVLALSGFVGAAVDLSGNIDINMSGCQIASNSEETDSVNIKNAATLTVDCIATVGGVNEAGALTMTECSSASTGISPITNPYEDLEVPTIPDCDEDGFSTGTDLTISPATAGGTRVFCNGLAITSDAVVDFEPGIYIIDRGSITINGQATVTGDDVTFIFTSSTGSGYGDIRINGGANVVLSAPTSGDFSGVLFFQDADTPTAVGNSLLFTGGSTTELTGVIYAPSNDVTFTGGNETDDNGCLQIVANTVTFSGDADLENDCTSKGIRPIFVEKFVTVVE